jgi:hypothetical protein
MDDPDAKRGANPVELKCDKIVDVPVGGTGVDCAAYCVLVFWYRSVTRRHTLLPLPYWFQLLSLLSCRMGARGSAVG